MGVRQVLRHADDSSGRPRNTERKAAIVYPSSNKVQRKPICLLRIMSICSRSRDQVKYVFTPIEEIQRGSWVKAKVTQLTTWLHDCAFDLPRHRGPVLQPQRLSGLSHLCETLTFCATQMCALKTAPSRCFLKEHPPSPPSSPSKSDQNMRFSVATFALVALSSSAAAQNMAASNLPNEPVQFVSKCGVGTVSYCLPECYFFNSQAGHSYTQLYCQTCSLTISLFSAGGPPLPLHSSQSAPMRLAATGAFTVETCKWRMDSQVFP